MSDVQTANRKIQVFRANEAKDLLSAMYFAPMDDMQMNGLMALVKADYQKGNIVRILFSGETLGLSLTYAWFKKGFPLPRHSHNADCLYYIISGEMLYGTESLCAGDCMLVPANSLYTFETETGVEFIEVRKTARYDICYQSSEKAWQRQLEQTKARAPAWDDQDAPLAAQRMLAAS